MFTSVEQAKRFKDAGQIADSMLSPADYALYEAGCRLRDSLGFAAEGNSVEQDEAIIEEVERQYPGFGTVIDKWGQWHQGLMFGGSDS